ncbi:hypothetical protein Cgig2_032163 [Carnegiea gigantea]|uniref:Uncharacterized protein n=1 Tax=Carnegiea gigantea TaxID=171969 RepID=A0A9Q1GYB7_9CARY|nr:hypothetical protein Cgig2_032163 [Carnegiea gigantea]
MQNLCKFLKNRLEPYIDKPCPISKRPSVMIGGDVRHPITSLYHHSKSRSSPEFRAKRVKSYDVSLGVQHGTQLAACTLEKPRKYTSKTRTTGKHLYKEQVEETQLPKSKLKSKSRENRTPILMAKNNEVTQLMKMIEKIQAKIEESDKRVEAMAVVLQNLTKESQAENKKELSKEAPTKLSSNWKNNYQNKDKKASSSKEVYVVNSIIEHTPGGTNYTQALQQLFTKGKIDLPKIRLEIDALRQSKGFDPAKYCKHNRPRGHDTKNWSTFKNMLEKMFKSGQLPLPKAAQKPNNERTA